MRTQALVTESNARAIGTLVDWPNGESLGTWHAVAPLGRGGTAEVWHAVATDGREAALKLAKRELRGHAAANALIRREHAVLSAVASPYLVEPYELLEHDGVAVLALEYLPAGDMVPLLGAPPQQWLPAFRAVVGALADLARHGLAHGDVKARNVLFAADGRARLADLTAARPLEAPGPVTTPAYALPAQTGSTACDADCFALAVLLYELSTGRLPYGVSGAPAAGVELPAEARAPAEAGGLLTVATAALRARGRVHGLSYFIDALESERHLYG
jgi:eukaryotic-like serine/threonine-protein kinase